MPSLSLAEGKRQMSFQEGGPVIAQNPTPHAMSLFIPANLTFGGGSDHQPGGLHKLGAGNFIDITPLGLPVDLLPHPIPVSAMDRWGQVLISSHYL